MAKTRKTLQLKNLVKYDVLIEDTSETSTYFQVTNLPSLFTGGRNSFLLGGSEFLKPKSTILIEIIDSTGNAIYQTPVKNYVEGSSRLISVEINENTTVGIGYLIIMGEAQSSENGVIPEKWKNTYNVRWIHKIRIEPNLLNKSPIVLLNKPEVYAEEKRFYSISTASYTNFSVPFTASLTPTLYSGFQIGYLINAVSPTSFSADLYGSYITGSTIINNSSASVYLPITKILNSTTAFSSGELIKTTDGTTVDKIYLTSGSYNTRLFNTTGSVTSSTKLNYSKLNVPTINAPVSYAKLRVVKMNTVSGEIFKLKVHSKVASNISDYKLVADVPVITEELLVSSSIRGDLAVGDFNISNTASNNWYSDGLVVTTNAVYPISGSAAYYNTSTTINPNTLYISDNVLLRSVYADVSVTPISPQSIIDGTLTSSKFSSTVSESGYFIGTKRSVTLFDTTEYTLKLDAYYRRDSGSYALTGNTPTVDIYIMSGEQGSLVVSNNPLGQKIGQLSIPVGVKTFWFENNEFNFTPQISVTGGTIGFGLRFVISNGFWNFSNISLKPASSRLFSPDEVQILVPNTEYRTELLQHKIEFFDINGNSTDLAVISTPTYFSGSV